MNEITLIAPNISLQGKITSQQPIVIQAQIEGRLYSDTSVIVDISGQCKGEIVAKEIVIKGFFEGKVTCDLLTICNGGIFKGDIKSHLLVIEQKGSFEGSRHIIEPQWNSPKKEREPIAHLDTENILL